MLSVYCLFILFISFYRSISFNIYSLLLLLYILLSFYLEVFIKNKYLMLFMLLLFFSPQRLLLVLCKFI